MSEHKEQCALIRWFDMQYKPHKGRMFATPNAGKRNMIAGARLKAEGMRAGVPDLMLPVARKGYNGLFIELKTKTGRLQDNQRCWLDYLSEQGYLAVECKGWEVAKQTIEGYLDE